MKWFKVSLVAVACLIWSDWISEARPRGSAPTVYDQVVIFAGQSQFIVPNLNCTSLNAYANLQSPISNVKISDMSGSFSTYQACSNSNPAGGGGTSTSWGAEAQFAYRWSQDNPTKTLYIIKNAIGSTPLANSGSSTDCVYGTANINWSPSSNAANCFAATTSLISTAIANLQAAGHNPKVMAILWYQGGTDAQVQVYADAYAANLASFISTARTQWAGWSAPVIIARLSSQTTATYSSTVRTAQTNAATLTTPVIDTDTFGLQGDNVHPSAAGNIQLGDAFYSDYVNPIAGP